MSVKRYRITADVYAFEDDMTDERQRLIERRLRDTGTGMGVCGLAHRQHHNRVRPILLAEVPEAVRRHVTALGLGWYLERHYA